MTMLSPKKAELRDGNEKFISKDNPLNYDLAGFWQWSQSDLLSNATRGVLAEYIVAIATGISREEPRNEWSPYDLETPEGIKIEVKSAAYLQSWGQKNLSRIVFSIAPAKVFDYETGNFATVQSRPSDVYVFALLDCQSKENVNPLNLDQWTFYVMSTKILNDIAGDRNTISLPVLRQECRSRCDFSHLREAVKSEASRA